MRAAVSRQASVMMTYGGPPERFAYNLGSGETARSRRAARLPARRRRRRRDPPRRRHSDGRSRATSPSSPIPNTRRPLRTTRASAVILKDDAPAAPCAMLRATDPYLAFARAVGLFAPASRPAPGVHAPGRGRRRRAARRGRLARRRSSPLARARRSATARSSFPTSRSAPARASAPTA